MLSCEFCKISKNTFFAEHLGWLLLLQLGCIKVGLRCFGVVSTSGYDIVLTLCNAENPTSDFVSFSTSDQILKQR